VLAGPFAGRPGVGQALAEAFHLDLQLRRLRGERVLLYGPGAVRVQEPLLYLFQFGQAFAGLAILFFAQASLIVTGGGQVPAEPVAAFVVGDAQRGKVALNLSGHPERPGELLDRSLACGPEVEFRPPVGVADTG